MGPDVRTEPGVRVTHPHIDVTGNVARSVCGTP